MAKGFIFGFGFFIGLVAAILVVFIVLGCVKLLSCRRKKVKLSLWKDYLAKITAAESYDEAAFVSKLIEGCTDDDKVMLPKGYAVDSKTKVRFKKNGDLKLKTKRWIIKKEKSKNSHESEP